MIQFMCPSCGKRVHGDDSFAGKHVICPECGQSVMLRRADAEATGITDTIPTFPAASKDRMPPDDFPVLPVAKRTPHVISRLIPILICCAVGGTCVCLLIPPMQRSHRPAHHTITMNNLKQIGLGMLSFHDTHKRLPFNGDVPAVGGDEKSGSWAFQILPFVDHPEVFGNPRLLHLGVHAYCCPKRGRNVTCTTGPWSDYCINPWLNDPKEGKVNAPDRKLNLKDITDGHDSTVFVGQGAIDRKLYSSINSIPQSTDIFKGGNPALARRSTINQQDTAGVGTLHWGGPYSTGTHVLMCDATVRVIPYRITGGNIRNGIGDSGLAPLLTPAGTERVELPD